MSMMRWKGSAAPLFASLSSPAVVLWRQSRVILQEDTMSRIVFTLTLFSLPIWATDTKVEDLPLLFTDNFEKGADRWETTDPAAWKVVDLGGKRGKVFSQHAKQSKYKPPHRSPYHIALVKELNVGDFILEAKCQSTVKDYPHRDLCLFFGYQDPAHF